MTTKAKQPANQIATVNGTVIVDPEATYSLTLASAVRFLGQWHRPSDRNITFRGDALIAMAAEAREGAIIDATPL